MAPEAEKWPGVAEVIADRIRSGGVKPGDRLPRAEDLARDVGVAARTARKAVAHLAALGYLDVRRNVGIFVVGVPPRPLPALPPRPDPLLDLQSQVAALAARQEDLEKRLAELGDRQDQTESDVRDLADRAGQPRPVRDRQTS